MNIYPDTPEMRLYLYALNPETCFERKYDGSWTTRNWAPVSTPDFPPFGVVTSKPRALWRDLRGPDVLVGGLLGVEALRQL